MVANGNWICGLDSTRTKRLLLVKNAVSASPSFHAKRTSVRLPFSVSMSSSQPVTIIGLLITLIYAVVLTTGSAAGVVCSLHTQIRKIVHTCHNITS